MLQQFCRQLASRQHDEGAPWRRCTQSSHACTYAGHSSGPHTAIRLANSFHCIIPGTDLRHSDQRTLAHAHYTCTESGLWFHDTLVSVLQPTVFTFFSPSALVTRPAVAAALGGRQASGHCRARCASAVVTMRRFTAAPPLRLLAMHCPQHMCFNSSKRASARHPAAPPGAQPVFFRPPRVFRLPQHDAIRVRNRRETGAGHPGANPARHAAAPARHARTACPATRRES